MVIMSKDIKKVKYRLVENNVKRECSKEWHVFQPAGSKKCVCSESTDNPLNELAIYAKKHDL